MIGCTVVIPNESKFAPYTSNGRDKVWIGVGDEELVEACLRSRVQFANNSQTPKFLRKCRNISHSAH